MTQIGVQVKTSLLEEFRQDVENRYGSTYGHMRTELQRAMRAYLEGSHGGDTVDRLRRIEEKIDRLDHASAENKQKKKDSGVSNVTEKRLSEITEQIEEETGGSNKVHEEVVELAIRENAGGSDPTIRRYKELLEQDEVIFKHPTKRRFFTEAEDYVMAVNAMRKGGKIDKDVYSEILNDYGEEWWLAQQEQEQQDQPKGFQ